MAHGASVRLAWDASTGPNVASYTLRYGTTSGSYPTAMDVGNVLTATASNLVAGKRYFFVVTARNTSGLDSLPSNEVDYTLPGGTPNRPPTLNPINGLTLNEDAGAQTVGLSGIGPGATNEIQSLTVTAVSSNPALIPTPTVSYTSPNPSGNLLFTPVSNGSGTATITVTVNDGQAQSNTVTRSFMVTVNPVNDPPTLNPIGNLTLNTNAGGRTITLTGIGSGAANESQSLVVTASHNNPALLNPLTVSYTSPATTGVLTLMPLANATGSAVVTVTVNDGGTANSVISRTFTVTVSPLLPATLYVEAESGTVAAPMVSASDANAAGGRFVYSTTAEQGTASFSINITQPGDYVAWCRILSVDAGVDSLYVSVDNGAEDIYDTAKNISGADVFSSAWQWTPLNGRSAGFPRVFNLSAGAHSLRFRSREAGTPLDAFYLTNDRGFNPANPPKTNAPPIVSAGPDKTVQLPASASLTGSVTDDGLPSPPGAWTVNWTKVSGPGTVQFSAPGSPSSTASFSVAGQYVLRLTANDGALAASDDVAVTVQAAASAPVNAAPTLGPLSNITLNPNVGPRTVTLISITSGATNESQPLVVTATHNNPSLLTNLNVSYSSPGTNGLLKFTPQPNALGSAVITVTVNDGGNTSNLVSRSFTVTVAPLTIQTIYREAEAGALVAPMAAVADTSAAGGSYVQTSTGEQGTVSWQVDIPQAGDYVAWCRVWPAHAGVDSFYVSVDNGPEDVYDAGMNRLGDNGYTNTWRWNPLNGRLAGLPRVFSLSQGAHTLKFRGRESGSRLDAFYLTNDRTFDPNGPSNPVNAAPLVSAGPDITILLPASANLAGSVTDDGLPRPPGAWTATWTKISGLGTVQFATPNAPATAASFSVAGQYVLRLTATDGVLSSSDDVTIAVQPASDVTGPVVPNFRMAGSDARNLTMVWSTDEPALCLLEYGLTPALGSSTPLETVRSTSHSVTLTGLTPNTTYYVRVRAVDAAGNVGFSNLGNAGTPPVSVFSWAAEAGTLTPPMRIRTADTALDSRYVISDTNDVGAVLFPIQVAVASDYRLWCRLWAPATGFDSFGSFYVSLNGTGEDLFDVAAAGWVDGWHWVAVNGRGGAGSLTINPRRFSLTAGQHQFKFRVHEAGILLDELILSNEPDWVPGIHGTAPTLAASAVSSNRINLTWTDSLSDEEGFLLEWSGDGRNFSELATLMAGLTSFQHVGVNTVSNYYRLYGFNESDRTDYSNVAIATKLPSLAAPSTLTAVTVTRERVRLTWTDVSPNESGFVVERSADGVNYAPIGTTAANVTVIDDTPPSPDRYYYRVRAFNIWGTSAPSPVASARVR